MHVQHTHQISLPKIYHLHVHKNVFNKNKNLIYLSQCNFTKQYSTMYMISEHTSYITKKKTHQQLVPL